MRGERWRGRGRTHGVSAERATRTNPREGRERERGDTDKPLARPRNNSCLSASGRSRALSGARTHAHARTLTEERLCDGFPSAARELDEELGSSTLRVDKRIKGARLTAGLQHSAPLLRF